MLNYSMHISWSDKDDGFIATVPEFNNLSAFGKTYREALEELEVVLSGYVEVYNEDNVPLPEPKKLSDYSGQIRIRMPKELHQCLAREADNQGVSLNQYMVYLLSKNYPLRAIEQFGVIVSKLLIDSEDPPTSESIGERSLWDLRGDNPTTINRWGRL